MNRTNLLWKLSAATFAAATLMLWFRDSGRPGQVDARAIAASSGPASARSRRLARLPLRASAPALGIDEDELVASLEKSRRVRERRLLCEKLAVVASERSIHAMGRWLEEGNRDLESCAFDVLGAMGSEPATDLLIDTAQASPRLRGYALRALGEARTPAAFVYVKRAASSPNDRDREVAIASLGKFDDKAAADALMVLSEEPGRFVLMSVFTAAQDLSPERQRSLMHKLLDASDREVRLSAIDELGAEDAEVLMELLGSGDEMTRQAAVRALGQAGVAEAVEPLAVLAKTGSQMLKYSATSALGEIATDAAIEVLLEMMWSGRDTELAVNALSAHLNKGVVRQQLIDAASAPGPQQRAVFSALTMERGPDVDRLMVTMANDPKGVARQSALDYLISSKHPEALAAVVKVSEDGTMSERQRVVSWLRFIDNEEANAELLKIAKGRDPQLRAAALEQLAQSGFAREKVESLLAEGLSSGTLEPMTAVRSLLVTQGTKGRKVILDALQSDNPALVEAVVNGIGGYGTDASVLEGLARVANSSKGALRQQAIRTLASNGSDKAVELVASLRDEAPEDFAMLLSTVSFSGGESARELVFDAASHDSPTVRAAAASTLGMLSTKEGSAALAELAKDSDENVRSAALPALLQVDVSAGRQIIRDMTRSEDPEQRVAAARSLYFVPEKEELIARLLGDDDADVVTAAISSYQPGIGGDAQSRLLSLLRDEDVAPTLRVQAASALSKDPSLSQSDRDLISALTESGS